MSFSTRNLNVVDNATPEIRAKLAAFGEPLNSVMGRAVANHLQAHYLRWNAAHPNKLGGSRTNLGAQFARATNFVVVVNGFIVSTNHVAARQRLEGGEIKKGDKMLTIPATPEAYGKRAGEFNNLRFALVNGHPALVEAQATKIKSTKKGFTPTESVLGTKVFYWLANSVNQKPDPTLLPPEKEMVDEALAAATRTINRAHARGGSQ